MMPEALDNNEKHQANHDGEKPWNNDFTLTHKDETININFSNVTFTVSLGFRKETKTIIRGVHGRFPAKQMTAILGPSGAGKSTLLDILSGYRIHGIEGTVCVNGEERNMNSFRRSSTYITQDDRLQPLLTVLENMRISADLKMGTNVPRHEKDKRVEEILTSLGLRKHAKTRTSKLSGGQKKRLSIALELVNDPTVLFLDEPTTGLDSSSCGRVLKLLKMLAVKGRTIICTIHQPSATLFRIFDNAYVLAKGQCVYHGSTESLVPYLEHMKLPCPKFHSPADYIIELSSGEYGEDKIALLVKGSQNGECNDWFGFQGDMEETNNYREKPKSYQNQRNVIESEDLSTLHQINILHRRGFIKMKREPVRFIKFFIQDKEMVVN